MATRTLHSPPRILPLYARTVAPLVPGASRLPWIGGAGGEIPELELMLPQAHAEAANVDAYAAVCGFPVAGSLPPTYPHVLAFPIHLALMADARFPFAAVGLVHVANTIAQQRPIDRRERLDLSVRATPLRPHTRGRAFSIVTQARAGGELVWWERSTMLHREAKAGAASGAADGGSDPALTPPPASEAGEQWTLPDDLGRRYAGVSGDRNPIHLHPLTARALGFPRAIAHGMWTKARCLAAIERAAGGPPAGAFSVEVRFRRAILLPARVAFATARGGEEVRFGVRDEREGTEHLAGRMRSVEDIVRALEASP